MSKEAAGKCKIGGLVALVAGGALAIFAIFVPSIYNNGIQNGAEGANTLTSEHAS